MHGYGEMFPVYVAALFETSVLKEVRILHPLSPQKNFNAANKKI